MLVYKQSIGINVRYSLIAKQSEVLLGEPAERATAQLFHAVWSAHYTSAVLLGVGIF